MVSRFRAAARERFGDRYFDNVAVLGMHLNETAETRRGAHHLEDRLVIDLQNVLVGHEHLERVHAFALDHLRDLFDRLGPAVGDRQVKRVIDRRFAGGLSVPRLDRVGERIALLMQREIDDRRRAAERRRRRSRSEVVGRRRAAEGHVEVRVRIDQPRENVRPDCVEGRVTVALDFASDGRDRAVFDEHVRRTEVRRRDDRAAFYNGADKRSLHV